MNYYKALAYVVYLKSLRITLGNNSEIWEALFRQFMSEHDRSASALLIGCMRWGEDDGCLEKHSRYRHTVLVEDCLKVPSLPQSLPSLQTKETIYPPLSFQDGAVLSCFSYNELSRNARYLIFITWQSIIQWKWNNYLWNIFSIIFMKSQTNIKKCCSKGGLQPPKPLP